MTTLFSFSWPSTGAFGLSAFLLLIGQLRLFDQGWSVDSFATTTLSLIASKGQRALCVHSTSLTGQRAYSKDLMANTGRLNHRTCPS